jgi:hypothetical protein
VHRGHALDAREVVASLSEGVLHDAQLLLNGSRSS